MLETIKLCTNKLLSFFTPLEFFTSVLAYAGHFLGQVPGCAYTICLYSRIEISCIFPSGSPCRPSRVSPCTPSVLICCIRLLCD